MDSVPTAALPWSACYRVPFNPTIPSRSFGRHCLYAYVAFPVLPILCNR
jgi:hypothetical protein